MLPKQSRGPLPQSAVGIFRTDAEQLEERAASLGELVQADLRKSAEQLRAESAATAAEHATRIEALTSYIDDIEGGRVEFTSERGTSRRSSPS